VLRNNPGWDLQRIKAAMNSEENNLQVNLVTRIPILTVYGDGYGERKIRFGFSTTSMVMTQNSRKRWPLVIPTPGRPVNHEAPVVILADSFRNDLLSQGL